jgi:tetratricopeptide (TPR) repeat protein
MSDKVTSIIQKAAQERKRAQFERALKRLEGGIAAHPDEIDLYLEAIDTAIEGGELLQAANLLRTVQDKFTKERERVQQFVREKLQTVHDPSLARCAVEHAVKRRELEAALDLLADVPDHTIRELLNRARTKAQSLKSATGGGQALRGETVVNELSNAILSLRLGNIKEAMASFTGIVEEKPVEHKSIEAFLASLAGKHPKAGRIRHARGCAMLAGGNEIEAIQLFVEAARLEPACAPSSIEALQAMLASSHHPGKVRRALAETQLVKGDLDDAAQTLRDYLTDHADNAREVIMVVKPFVDGSNGMNACTWLALEQALSLEQSSVVLDLMRPLQAKGHGIELFGWLEAHPLPLPPAELAIFHASLALEAKEYERAADMLDDVCAASPADIPAVLSLIERHRSADDSIDVLHMKYSPREHTPTASRSTDDGDFQTFEPNEFKLETSAGVVTSASAPEKAKSKPRFNSSPFSSPGATDAVKDTHKPMIERTELSLDDDAPAPRAEEEPAHDAAPSPLEIDITEEHVTNVAQKLYEAGAAVFFHIDDEAAGQAAADANAPELAPAVEAAAQEKPAPVQAAQTAPAAPAPPAVKEAFDVRYARFSRGELANSAVLELLEEAVEDGRADELHELLYFEPETGEEHFARYYFQAEYHLLCNRPIQALEILARLDTPDLGAAHRQRVWYKIAVAQRMMHNYAGASETLDRLVENFPARDEFARLKRRNHEQFIEHQSLAVTTLEKTSSLD